MKTTLDLPDELLRAVKMRAVQENRRIKDVVADLLWYGLAGPSKPRSARPQRVQLPLVECAHEAAPADEMTPDRVAEILAADEARAAVGR